MVTQIIVNTVSVRAARLYFFVNIVPKATKPIETRHIAVLYYEKLAGDIIAAAGGKDNIAEVAHCATRLRLVLKETPAGAKEKVSAMAGVITVVESGGQFQVVIGTHVTDVYNVAAEMLHLENSEGSSKATKGIAAAVIGAISGCVSPIVYVLAACGLLQGALIIATALYPAVEANTTFQVLTYMSWTPFTYLPVLIALALRDGLWCILAGIRHLRCTLDFRAHLSDGI